jgi:Zn-dependent peptidase ImmA (M78 family)
MGTIRELRDLVPIRRLRFAEALRVAELQAARLLALAEVHEPPVPEAIVAELPRIQVERVYPLGASGFTQWAKGRWLVALNAGEPPTRQRFSLAHEFKHVLDHPFIGLLYPAEQGLSTAQRAEQVCDHFAACLLMPRPWVKRAWGNGTQDVGRLAAQFDVSPEAMAVRLQRIGLVDRRSSRHRVAA